MAGRGGRAGWVLAACLQPRAGCSACHSCNPDFYIWRFSEQQLLPRFWLIAILSDCGECRVAPSQPASQRAHCNGNVFYMLQ